jgi:hypothetical protein
LTHEPKARLLACAIRYRVMVRGPHLLCEIRVSPLRIATGGHPSLRDPRLDLSRLQGYAADL